MKRPTIIHGILTAFVFSVFTTPLLFAFSMLLPGAVAVKAAVAVVTAGYVALLFRRRTRRSGATAIGLILITVLLVGVMFTVSIAAFVLLAIGCIWAVRSSIAYGGLVSAFLDLILCGLSLTAALWGYFMSGSLSVAVWTFFLVQSLFIFIPRRFERKGGSGRGEIAADERADGFETARKEAHRALEQLLRESAGAV